VSVGIGGLGSEISLKFLLLDLWGDLH